MPGESDVSVANVSILSDSAVARLTRRFCVLGRGLAFAALIPIRNDSHDQEDQ
jgi:hypothetical protein